MNKYTKLYLGGTALYAVGISIAYFAATSPARCEENQDATVYQQKEKVEMQQDGHIDGRTLKTWVDKKRSMVILDARGGKWDDGRRIPGGKSLPADSPVELFTQVAPDKDALVVVYCGGIQCPAGKALAERMIGAGYSHVLEYAGGIKEWADEFQYPVERN